MTRNELVSIVLSLNFSQKLSQEISQIIQDPSTKISEISPADYRFNFKIFSPHLEQYYSVSYSTNNLVYYQTIFAVNPPNLHLGFIKDFIIHSKISDNPEILKNPDFLRIYKENTFSYVPEFLQNYELL